MKFDELNQDNWILFAIKNYDNPHQLHMLILKRMLKNSSI